MRTEHGVDEDQLEPGLPDEAQARTHVQDFVMMDWNVSAALGLSRRLEAELLVPVRLIRSEVRFLDVAGETLPEFESIHHRNETLRGLGDLALTGRFRVLGLDARTGLTLDLRAGSSFPTGGLEPNPFERARRGESHQHMFFGSGTFDPIAGLEGAYASGGVRLLGWSSVRARLYENRFGYRGPTQFTAGAGVETAFGLATWRFLVQPEVFHELPARWSGEPAPNSGRTDLIATAGGVWMPSAAWTAHLVVKLPWTVRAEGGQLRMPFVVLVGGTYALDLWHSSG
jgi:hypothetical protein